MKKQLKCYFKNGGYREYKEKDFTGFQIEDELIFIVLDGEKRIGIYSIDEIEKVEYNYEN